MYGAVVRTPLRGPHRLHRQEEAQGRAQTLLQYGKILTQPALDALAYCYPVAADRAKKLDDKHVGDGSPT